MLKRKSPMETDRKKKVTLPAALFNRSPLKNTENSSMFSNASMVNDPPCENHNNKKGKYIVISDDIQQEEQTYYCQKCAILLASKGFEVKKIDALQSKIVEKKKVNPREQELSDFLSVISDKIKVLGDNKKQSSTQLNAIEQKYEGELQRIDQFYEQLYIILDKYKNNQVHQIGLKKKSIEQQLVTYIAYATEKIQLMENMKQDIQSSHDSIVKDTPEQDYQLVMSHYKSNIGQISTDPMQHSLEDLNLPSIDTIQSLFSQLFESSRPGTYFSFDSSKKTFE